MQTEARVGVVVEGGQRGDGCSRKYVQVQPQKHQQAAIGTVSQLLSGGIASAVSKTCTALLARLTILFQMQRLLAKLVVIVIVLFIVLVSFAPASTLAANGVATRKQTCSRRSLRTKIPWYPPAPKGNGSSMQAVPPPPSVET